MRRPAPFSVQGPSQCVVCVVSSIDLCLLPLLLPPDYLHAHTKVFGPTGELLFRGIKARVGIYKVRVFV